MKFRVLASPQFGKRIQNNSRIREGRGPGVGSMSSSADVMEAGSVRDAARTALPSIALPTVPRSSLIWSRALTLASILVTLVTLDQLTYLLGDLWLLQSLGFESVFWTNFRMGAKLYAGAFVVFAAAIAVPAFLHDVGGGARAKIVQTALLIASVAALLAALYYHEFLLGGSDLLFGKTDPVFGIDLAFYVFNLPNLWVAWAFLMVAAILMLGFSIAAAILAGRERAAAAGGTRVEAALSRIATPGVRLAIGILGVVGAVGVWLSRYSLLLKDNSASSVKRGAEYVDVTGLFSNLNYITVTTFVLLGVTAASVVLLRALHRAEPAKAEARRRVLRRGLKVILVLVAADFAFKGLVVLRDLVAVRPNEPVVQLPYIARHVDATRAAYGLDGIEEIEFIPKGPGDPIPSAAELLESPTLKNAPLWPGFSSYLERWLDKQHAQRVLQTQGNTMVYGPTLELFQQQQKLRTYYNFLNVDSVRYPIGGEPRMFVCAVRETPLYEPVPWLAYWGQRFMLFTHGWGLVMAPAGETDAAGEPDYVSKNIPAEVRWPEIAVENPRVYYGEGSATMAFSNVDRMKELDYPTEQDRAETVLPAGAPIGVPIDSLLKRLVFGWRSGKFFELVFSDLIKDVDARPLLPHAARADRSRGAVPVSGLEPVRRRRGRRDPVDRERHDDDRPLSLQLSRGAGRQVRRALGVSEAGADGQLHRGLGQGDRGRVHGPDPFLQDPQLSDRGRLVQDLSRPVPTGGADAGGRRAPADLPDPALPHPVRRPLHLLPHERPHVLLQHGRHVGRRRRGPRTRFSTPERRSPSRSSPTPGWL